MERRRTSGTQPSWDLYEILGEEKYQGILIYKNSSRHCPFKGNQSPCKKIRAKEPISICSVIGHSFQSQQVKEEEKVVVCPHRFPEEQVIRDISTRYFPNLSSEKIVTLSEVKIRDIGDNAWRFDKVVLYSEGESGKTSKKPEILAFVEVQAVYISGNTTKLFKSLIERKDASTNSDAQTARITDFHPDYLSSAKRLIFQIIFKFPIASVLGVKLFAVVQKPLWETIQRLMVEDVLNQNDEGAPITWLIYDFDSKNRLALVDTKDTHIWQILSSLTRTNPNDASLKNWKDNVYKLIKGLIKHRSKKVSSISKEVSI